MIKSTIRYWSFRKTITRNLKREEIILPMDFQKGSFNKKFKHSKEITLMFKKGTNFGQIAHSAPHQRATAAAGTVYAQQCCFNSIF